MDHLFSDFRRKGIHAFDENDHLKRGEETSSQRYRAIENSRFLIVIFSDNYASSTRCLKELSKILECKKREEGAYEVRAIFYDVEPAMVRNQTGSYREAFMKHQVSNITDVPKWKEALTLAANLSGWDLQNMTNGYESNFIDKISKEIFDDLTDGPFGGGENLVGVYARAEKMDLLQSVGSDKVRMIGICGIGGIGKTALAKAIYNILYKHFEGCSFCENVKDVVKRHGLAHLQAKLLDDVIKAKDLKVHNFSQGISKRMRAIKVLIVLDDVDQDNQFEALAGKPEWFGSGSMIVITSRDRQLLKAHGVEEIYEVDLLNNDEALELFTMYAFKDKHPNEEFMKLSKCVVHYLHGLPLAIIDMGRFLFGKTLQEWESEIDKVRKHPSVHIQQVLRMSYDGLDSRQKNIFLDIACFFKGEKKDYIVKILDGSDLFSETNLRVLVDKSLITIDEDRVEMHDVIQEMGRQIVRDESEEPGKRSRLWFPKDVCDVLNNDKGTESVKGLTLDMSSSEANLCANTFTKLNNLLLLNLYIGSSSNYRDLNGKKRKRKLGIKTMLSTIFGEKLKFLSNELRLFCWHGYPYKHLPSTFYPESLVVLDLSYSCIKQLWSGSKGFKKLTLLKLNHCRNITTTPDFTNFPNLEELILEDCENLVVVHSSVKTLERLIVLNLKNCKNLESFPNITELETLKFLILSSCSKLEKIPEDLGKLISLVEFHVDGTAVKVIPSSLFSLRNLEILSIRRHKAIRTKSFLGKLRHPLALTLPSLSALSSLRVLNVSHCNLSSASLYNLEVLSLLEELDLSGNDFASIPANLSQFSRLSNLRMIGCKNLQALPELPSAIISLDSQHCTSMVGIPKRSTMYDAQNIIFDFKNCQKLVEEQSIENLVTMLLPQGRIDVFEGIHIFLPGNRIPGWFSNQNMGDCVKVELPHQWCYQKLKGFSTCAIVTPINPRTTSTYFNISCRITNFNGALINEISLLATDEPNIESNQVWLLFMKSDPRWEEARNGIILSFKVTGINCKVEQCGLRLVWEEDEEEEDDGSRIIRWC